MEAAGRGDFYTIFLTFRPETTFFFLNKEEKEKKGTIEKRGTCQENKNNNKVTKDKNVFLSLSLFFSFVFFLPRRRRNVFILHDLLRRSALFQRPPLKRAGSFCVIFSLHFLVVSRFFLPIFFSAAPPRFCPTPLSFFSSSNPTRRIGCVSFFLLCVC